MTIVDNLAVLIAGRRAGTIRQAYDGALFFSYESGYDAVPLSLSMPIDGAAFGDKVVRPLDRKSVV